MHYLEIVLDVADAFYPVALFIIYFSFGFMVADDLRDRAEARRNKEKTTDKRPDLPGQDGPA